MAAARSRASAMALGLAAVVACAHGRQQLSPSPPAFADSPLFADLRQRASAIAAGDANGDGRDDVAVALRDGQGFRPLIVLNRRKEATAGWGQSEPVSPWQRGCEGEPVQGEETASLSWIQLGGRNVLLLVAVEEDPDSLVQRLSLIDPSRDCHQLFSDEFSLPRPNAIVMSPHAVMGGVFAEDGIEILDQPKLVRLRGAEHEVSLLLGVRSRRLTLDDEGNVSVASAQRDHLAPRTVTATPITGEEEPPGQAVAATAEPSAHAEATSSVIALRMIPAAIMVELRHNCPSSEDDVGLTVALGEPLADGLGAGHSPAYRLGSPIPRASGIIAVGNVPPRGENNLQRTLLVLETEATGATLRLLPNAAAGTEDSCIKGVRAFGWK